MGQPDTAVGRGTATGTLPPMFVPAGRVSETIQAGFSATVDVAVLPTSGCTDETVFFTEITWEGRTFVFNHPLPVRVTQDEDGWTFESDEYRLMSYGDTRVEAESDFCFMFAECWDEIACEDDERLALGAVKQKRALLALVKTQE